MLIYDALVNDHNKVKGLLARLVRLNASDAEEGADLVEQIRDELIPHARAEEAVFYNSIRAVNTAKDLVWHGYEEHMQAEAILRTLQAATKIDADFTKLARKLKAALEHHIQEEEGKIFSVAKQLFTDDEAEVMCEAFEDLKPQVKEEGFMQTTLDMIANMMPPRLAAPLRSFTYRP
jgi:hemerythrin superfamily protein